MAGKRRRARHLDAELQTALDKGRVVRLRRDGRHVGRLDGIVVGLGVRWVLVRPVTAEVRLDGITALRRRRLRRVDHPHPGSLVVRAMAARDPSDDRCDAVVPAAAALALDPSTTGTLLRSVATHLDGLVVWAEELDPSVCWVGHVVGFDDKGVRMLVLDEDARWVRDPLVFPFKVITRIDLGSRFEVVRRRAAGPPPVR